MASPLVYSLSFFPLSFDFGIKNKRKKVISKLQTRASLNRKLTLWKAFFKSALDMLLGTCSIAYNPRGSFWNGSCFSTKVDSAFDFSVGRCRNENDLWKKLFFVLGLVLWKETNINLRLSLSFVLISLTWVNTNQLDCLSTILKAIFSFFLPSSYGDIRLNYALIQISGFFFRDQNA